VQIRTGNEHSRAASQHQRCIFGTRPAREGPSASASGRANGHVTTLRGQDERATIIANGGGPESAPLPQSKATVYAIDGARCALCGAPLGARGLRYQLVSPYRPDAKLTACHTCYKVARGEGYRPVT